jgi:hypothetical protein
VEIPALKNAFNQAMESVQKLGASSEETACKLSNEELTAKTKIAILLRMKDSR